jgi:hypothetical protein
MILGKRRSRPRRSGRDYWFLKVTGEYLRREKDKFDVAPTIENGVVHIVSGCILVKGKSDLVESTLGSVRLSARQTRTGAKMLISRSLFFKYYICNYKVLSNKGLLGFRLSITCRVHLCPAWFKTVLRHYYPLFLYFPFLLWVDRAPIYR